MAPGGGIEKSNNQLVEMATAQQATLQCS